MKIGDLARRAGVTPSAIRYYESQWLLPRPPRISGRRDYPKDAVARLRMIVSAREAGLSIRDLRQLRDAISDPYARISWHPDGHRQLEELTRRARHLAATRRLLRTLLRCGHSTLQACNIDRATRRGTPRSPLSPPGSSISAKSFARGDLPKS